MGRSRSLLVRRTRSLSPTTRDVYPKTRLSVWFPKQRNTRLRTTPIETVLRLRMVLKTTATLLRDPLAAMKLHRRWIPPTRPLWKARSKKQSAGLTVTLPPKRRNTKRSRRNSRVLPCLSSRRWEVLLEVCQVVCQVVCPIWEVCQELRQEAPLLQQTQLEDLRSKKLIKTVEIYSNMPFVR